MGAEGSSRVQTQETASGLLAVPGWRRRLRPRSHSFLGCSHVGKGWQRSDSGTRGEAVGAYRSSGRVVARTLRVGEEQCWAGAHGDVPDPGHRTGELRPRSRNQGWGSRLAVRSGSGSSQRRGRCPGL